MNVAELEPGPELDALVDKKVMGWKWDEKRCPICGWSFASHRNTGCVPGDCSQRPAPKIRADAHRPYSGEIAAAWDVFQKVKDQQAHIRLKFLNALHALVANDQGAPIDWPHAFWYVKPEMICKAALVAMEA